MYDQQRKWRADEKPFRDIWLQFLQEWGPLSQAQWSIWRRETIQLSLQMHRTILQLLAAPATKTMWAHDSDHKSWITSCIWECISDLWVCLLSSVEGIYLAKEFLYKFTLRGEKAKVTNAFVPKFTRTATLIPRPLNFKGNISESISQPIGPNDIWKIKKFSIRIWRCQGTNFDQRNFVNLVTAHIE